MYARPSLERVTAAVDRCTCCAGGPPPLPFEGEKVLLFVYQTATYCS